MLLAGGVEPMRGDQLLPGENRLGRDSGAATSSFLPSVFRTEIQMIESVRLE